MGAIRAFTERVLVGAMHRVSGAGLYIKNGMSYTPPPTAPMNWWQRGMSYGPSGYESFGPAQTCINILSQDLARLPVVHLREKENGQRIRVANSAATRIFRKPNSYQTRTDFFLYLMRSLLVDGNAYAVAKRNNRGEVAELYPINPQSCQAYIEPQSNEIVYQVGGDTTAQLADIDVGTWYPQRDILHIRLQTPKHPLVGESVLVAATDSIIAGTEINRHTAAFFSNMSRPSGILRHPGRLQEESLKRLKKRWMEITAGSATGEPAVLPEGMDWKQISMDAVNSELIASFKLTERQVAQLFRIPPFMLSDPEKTSISNVEGLMRLYVNGALGWYVAHVEDGLTDFFRLPFNEEIMFDLESALLRADFKERMDALGKGVQNGILKIDEARARESLPPVEYGDEVRVQQQIVPLSYGANLQPPGTTTDEEPTPPPEDDPEPTEEEQSAMCMNYLQQAMAE